MNKLVKFLFICLLFVSFSSTKASELDLLCDEGFIALKELVQHPKAYKSKKVKLVGDFFLFFLFTT